jgi:hypothetical protein
MIGLRACCLLASLVLVLHVPAVHGEIYAGILTGVSSWKFMARFCFWPSSRKSVDEEGLDRKGKFDYTIKYPAGSRVSLLMYYGGVDGWESVYKSSLDCSERIQAATHVKELPYMPVDKNATLTEERQGQFIMANHTDFFWFDTTQARYFYVALANCKPECYSAGPECAGTLDGVEYDFKFTNGPETSLWTHHFSVDEHTILQQLIAAVAIQTAMFIYSISVGQGLRKVRKLHYTVMMLLMSVFFALIGTIFKYKYYHNLGKTGKRNSTDLVVGDVFDGLADMLLILQLVLLAKGWTIVRHKISPSGRMKLAFYFTIYFVLYWVSLFWTQSFAREEVLYKWQSAPGHLVVGLRIFVFVWFCYAGYTTMHVYKKKYGFYKKFLIMGGTWILSMPICVALAYNIDNAYRAKILTAVELACNVVCRSVLIIMYDPSPITQAACNKSFPFHADFPEGGHARVPTRARLSQPAPEDANANAQIQLPSDAQEPKGSGAGTRDDAYDSDDSEPDSPEGPGLVTTAAGKGAGGTAKAPRPLPTAGLQRSPSERGGKRVVATGITVIGADGTTQSLGPVGHVTEVKSKWSSHANVGFSPKPAPIRGVAHQLTPQNRALDIVQNMQSRAMSVDRYVERMVEHLAGWAQLVSENGGNPTSWRNVDHHHGGWKEAAKNPSPSDGTKDDRDGRDDRDRREPQRRSSDDRVEDRRRKDEWVEDDWGAKKDEDTFNKRTNEKNYDTKEHRTSRDDKDRAKEDMMREVMNKRTRQSKRGGSQSGSDRSHSPTEDSEEEYKRERRDSRDSRDGSHDGGRSRRRDDRRGSRREEEAEDEYKAEDRRRHSKEVRSDEEGESSLEVEKKVARPLLLSPLSPDSNLQDENDENQEPKKKKKKKKKKDKERGDTDADGEKKKKKKKKPPSSDNDLD